MQELECAGENVAKYVLSNAIALGFLFCETALGQFNIPVAENIPNKVVDCAEGYADFKVIERARNACYGLVVLCQNPLVKVQSSTDVKPNRGNY